ncbi:FecR family protein [Chitinophaga sp. YR573]|uniref:FecR family protein n=1 Tax=Chitinophaga sp. YR573 TaxID=1881040 RepID=UPI0008D86CB7|nr:FecR domain-containing protein [Chitinophaga sp. YR573]SEW37546.1 FecR family protein [Chitinophaga sp. YR573]
MAYNDEHIFQLILEKLSGEISDENRLYLEQAAREDDNIRRCLEEMEEASDVVGPEFMDDVYNEIAWSNVLSLLDNEHPATKIVTVGEHETPLNKTPEIPTGTTVELSKRPTALRTWLVAAATLIIISSLLYFFLAGTNKQPVPIAKNKIVIPSSGDIQLLLDNGKTIPLPGSEGNMSSIAALTNKEGEWGTLLVPTGKNYKLLLADGSAVHLNAYSSLRFPFNFSGKIREVFLSGEGYFTIAQKAEKPFIVHSGATAVKVLGTSFNINAYSDSLIVTSLIEGSILTSDDEEPEVQLQPGTEAIYRKGYLREIHSFDENITLAWRKGQYNYYNESLGTLDAVILHWYGKQLLFKDSALAAKKLTGIIERDKPLTDFLDGLGKTSGLTYQVTGDKIYLTEKQ